jgi:hypothetical protein
VRSVSARRRVHPMKFPPMPNREESALFVIVVDTPGGDLSYSSRECSRGGAGGTPSQRVQPGGTSSGKAASMGRHRSVASLRKILFGGRQARAHGATAPLFTIEMVDRRTEIAHRVTDEAFAAGRRDEGRYWAMCGAQVFPASLTAPARGHCPACERRSAPTRKGGRARGDR